MSKIMIKSAPKDYTQKTGFSERRGSTWPTTLLSAKQVGSAGERRAPQGSQFIETMFMIKDSAEFYIEDGGNGKATGRNRQSVRSPG
jgi:hypothetical protein